MHSIKCGHCSTYNQPVYHRNKAAVAACARARHLARSQRTVPLANSRMVPISTPAAQAPVQTPVNSWESWNLKTPRAMVEAMRDGRYAVCPEGGEEYSQHVFLRVSRPKSGKKRGCLVIQTQHSDAYSPFITIYPSGRVFFSQKRDRLDMALLMVCADPFTTAMKYAEIKKVCCRCGKQLTDARSRYYGIGPECEKHFPEIINMIHELKGVFVS